jgi:hypothetical protein
MRLCHLLILFSLAGASPEMNGMTEKYTNRLINESSPYLLSHAHNPVNWYPWSAEALEKAKQEDKPIFLSIGYAACHWCHVMERESFENEPIAAALNENYVSIKVDREQRPDIDQIYMTAAQAMTGSGGWPLSVFLTPDLKPFFAGTYFPPDNRYGRPGFMHVITELAKSYKTEREGLEEMANRLTDALKSHMTPEKGEEIPLEPKMLETAIRALINNYDPVNGGFGAAPKFPHPTELSFMLRYAVIKNDDTVLGAVEKSLQKMAYGGVYDQFGGGFHRYSVDARWLVPHFEKMLYDNALLAIVYGEAYQITQNPLYLRIMQETLDFILREMTDSAGGFYSALDADSEGEEGKFYVWKKDEIDSLLGKKAEPFCRYFNITDLGNFEGNSNIPNIDSSSFEYLNRSGIPADEFQKTIDESKRMLLDVRNRRVRPATDDKILTSWNGLAISALARGFQISGDERYRDAALSAATFIKSELYRSAALVHSYRGGKFSDGEFLEDYAYLTAGLIDLYESVYDYRWIEFSSALAERAREKFFDSDGNFFLAPDNQSDHFIRPRDITDGALPAPGSIMMQALLRLSVITGREVFKQSAEMGLRAVARMMSSLPYAMTSALTALDFLTSDSIEIVIVGDRSRSDFLREVYQRFIPLRVLIVSSRGEENIPLLEGRKSDGATTGYLCRNRVCLLPIKALDDWKVALREQ